MLRRSGYLSGRSIGEGQAHIFPVGLTRPSAAALHGSRFAGRPIARELVRYGCYRD